MHRALDAAGVGLSTLCLVHCLALPLVAATAPLAAHLAEAEWVHWAIIALAAPAAILAIAPSVRARPFPWAISLLALLGLGGLISALFTHAEVAETALTTIGGLLLASAHILNWRHAHNHAHVEPRA